MLNMSSFPSLGWEVLILVDIIGMDKDRQGYEYQITILNVKMKVKFPCRMKIEHQGSLLTGETPLSDDNRYIFNQTVTLKDSTNKDCFELTVNLLTDKGAKYIAGIIKLYQSEMVRSEGERLVLSLSKCIDTEAFCEVKVDMVNANKINKNVPYDRKSALQRDVPIRNKEAFQADFSPHRSAYNVRIQESKSEYQFPLHQPKNPRAVVQPDWQTKSKSRYMPQTVYQKSRVAPRPNYVNMQESAPLGFQMETGSMNRQKMLEAEVYKQGYQKLKQKYRKETELSKQELNKRLALQNNENNLKLQIMRLKLKAEQSDKTLAQKNSRLKEQQIQLVSLQQKESENSFLRDENNKKQNTIRVLDDKVRSLTRSLEQMKEMADERGSNDGNKMKDLQVEMNSMKVKFQTRESELEKQSKARQELLHEKEMELMSKTDSLERQRKTVSDLQKSLQNRQYEMDKLLQNQRNNSKAKVDEQRAKIEHLQRELFKMQQQKKDMTKEIEQFKSTIIKMDYQKKLLNQELETMKVQFSQVKAYKEKFTEITRQNRTIIEERSHLERQLERTIQNKETNISEINKQFQDQVEYYKRINRELDEKFKNASNKLIEIEGQLDISRNQQDKIRRNLESSIKEAVDAKQKEKSARKGLKSKEQEMLSMETELATLKQKLKNIDQIYKLEGDKHREEIDKVHIQLDNEVDKNGELQENNNQLTMELNKLKIKLQYSEDRADKETLNLRDKQNQVEGLIKDYEQQVSGLDQTINSLRASEKELSGKLQKTEMELIKSEERCERGKKDIKILDERCSNLDNNLKMKVNEVQVLQVEKETWQKKYHEIEVEINNLKNDHLSVSSDRSKVSKMYEMTQEDVKKLKSDIATLTSTIGLKDKQIEELRSLLKGEKEENVKLDLKYANFKKQVDRNKDTLFDVIQKSLYTLPLGIKEDSRKNVDLLLKKPAENTFAEYFNMMSGHAKQIKQSLVKQVDLIKQLQREKERLQEQVASSSNKNQNTEMILKKQIDELQLELQHVIEQKQLQLADYSQNLEEMDSKIKEFQTIVEELNSQIEELNFTNSSMKMDYEVLNEQNQKKIINLKKLTEQLEEKIDYQVMVMSQLDERCGMLENNAELLQTTIENQSQAGLRKEKMIQELKQFNNTNEKIIEDLKRTKKELLEKVSELDLYLQTEKELNEKNKQLLAEEQSKANDLKSFISSMMKQKEAAIKSELQRSEVIINLETNLHEVSKDLELVSEENVRNFKNLQAQKQANKKMQAAIKELQNEKKEEKAKYSKLLDTVREKDREMLNRDEVIKKLELKLEKTVEKLKIEVKELQEELQLKISSNIEQTRESNQKTFQLETQIQKKTLAITVLEAKIAQMEEQLFAQREKTIQLEDSISKIKSQNEELRMKVNEMDSNLNEANDETKLKEEQLFDFSGKNYNLEMKLEAKHQEHLQEMEYLNNEWNDKYDSMCEEYEQRLELIEKERDYFKSLGEEKDREITKLNQTIRANENSEINTRKLYEERLRKVEEEKLAILSTKNTEVQRGAQDVRTQGQTLKLKEAELRKLTNELEVARKTISNLDQKSRDYDEKMKGVNKLYQNEMEQLKKRDVVFKSYKETVINYLWNTEREIKKGVQNFIKQFLDVSEDKNSQKVVQLARVLQKSIVDVLASKPVEK